MSWERDEIQQHEANKFISSLALKILFSRWTRGRAAGWKWLVGFIAENVLANTEGQRSKTTVKDEGPHI